MSGSDVTRLAFGGGRMTGPRKVIAEAACSLPGAFTVEELAACVRELDSAAGATATVYRAVAAMEAAGFVERVGERGGAALFARCGDSAHHHHIVCDGCGKVAHAECPLGPQAHDAAQGAGFVLTRHQVTLYGLCPTCAAEKTEG